MANLKKQTFWGGAATLAAAVAVVKIIGALYKIPLGNMLTGEGMDILARRIIFTMCC
ncbi:MAG: hypothetical protein PHT34_03290 [Oscillospiraceae bacterium]|nr:hypothetical protein [Oscillospiraceae bacterium]